MKYVVAVSGGVDSVVLLDMLVKKGSHDLVVAHFDHGIRDDSAADARFVAAVAKRYGLPYEGGEGKLGAQASEEVARLKRYEFLRSIAQKTSGRIVTAHHQGDVLETIAINLTRGTGWRGLAVLGDPTIERPLLKTTKRELYEYANAHNLEWVEDETNGTEAYLRNRLRKRLGALSADTKQEIYDLYESQARLQTEIDAQAESLMTDSRYFMTMVDELVASELLRRQLATESMSLTRPQRTRLLHAIKTARPGTTFEAGDGVKVNFTTRQFIVKHPL